jgi:hypothetical protein
MYRHEAAVSRLTSSCFLSAPLHLIGATTIWPITLRWRSAAAKIRQILPPSPPRASPIIHRVKRGGCLRPTMIPIESLPLCRVPDSWKDGPRGRAGAAIGGALGEVIGSNLGDYWRVISDESDKESFVDHCFRMQVSWPEVQRLGRGALLHVTPRLSTRSRRGLPVEEAGLNAQHYGGSPSLEAAECEPWRVGSVQKHAVRGLPLVSLEIGFESDCAVAENAGGKGAKKPKSVALAGENNMQKSMMMMMIGSTVFPSGGPRMGAQPKRRPWKWLVFAIRRLNVEQACRMCRHNPTPLRRAPTRGSARRS